MQDFNLQVGSDYFLESSYRICRTSDAYSFFNTEFHELAYDLNGNILLPNDFRNPSKEKKNAIQSVFESIKEQLTRKDSSIAIPMGRDEYSFFATEYRLSKDANQNIIVPEDEHTQIKSR